MTNRRILVAIAMLAAVGAANLMAGDVVVIANPSVSAASISADELKGVFLLTKSTLSDGSRAEPVLEKLGQPAVRAMAALGPQGGRRLAMMSDDMAPGLLDVIGRYGDKAMDFIWRHKEVLAGGAALTAFLSDPEPYLNGTADLARVGLEAASNVADTVVEHAVMPAMASVGDAAADAADSLTRVLLIGLLTFGLVIILAVKSGVFRSVPFRFAMRLAGRQVVSAISGKK